MSELTTIVKPAIPKISFRWRTNGGEFLYPKDMTTKHLFYTLRMIWNHSMPDEARSENYIKHNFGPFYTQKYIEDAVRYIGKELQTRNDLRNEWKDELAKFTSYFTKMIEVKGAQP